MREQTEEEGFSALDECDVCELVEVPDVLRHLARPRDRTVQHSESKLLAYNRGDAQVGVQLLEVVTCTSISLRSYVLMKHLEQVQCFQDCFFAASGIRLVLKA